MKCMQTCIGIHEKTCTQIFNSSRPAIQGKGICIYPLITHSNLFDSQLNYGNLIWGQNVNTIKLLTILQKKALRLMNLKPRNFHTSPLFLTLNILKLPDKIILENCLWIN